ncbi:MAG TPA: hypothetical protein VIV11_05245 [Kofleriaceae bacterium]
MAEKKPTPRSTKVVAATVFGGLIAAVLGQQFVPWTLESQTNTLIAVAAGAVLGGVIAWFATRPSA